MSHWDAYKLHPRYNPETDSIDDTPEGWVITINKPACTVVIHERQSGQTKLRKIADRSFPNLDELSLFVGEYVQSLPKEALRKKITYIGVRA